MIKDDMKRTRKYSWTYVNVVAEKLEIEENYANKNFIKDYHKNQHHINDISSHKIERICDSIAKSLKTMKLVCRKTNLDDIEKTHQNVIKESCQDDQTDTLFYT